MEAVGAPHGMEAPPSWVAAPPMASWRVSSALAWPLWRREKVPCMARAVNNLPQADCAGDGRPLAGWIQDDPFRRRRLGSHGRIVRRVRRHAARATVFSGR